MAQKIYKAGPGGSGSVSGNNECTSGPSVMAPCNVGSKGTGQSNCDTGGEGKEKVKT